MLHFAYGSNMDRGIMRRHAPWAEPVGVALLAGYRFVITADGYASVESAQACSVYGVLWRLTPRDRVILDVWENIAAGQYRAAMLTVNCAGRRRPALVYVARPRRAGWPKAGYMELVLGAARAWHLPSAYVTSLQRWLPRQPRGVVARRLRSKVRDQACGAIFV